MRTKKPLRRTFLFASGIVLLAATALAAQACGGTSVPNPFRPRVRHEPTVLEVDNRHWADMTISVRRGGTALRLGLVTTNGRRSFEIPPAATAAGMSATFLADPVGSESIYESPMLTVLPGETYVWTLAVSLPQSTLVRR